VDLYVALLFLGTAQRLGWENTPPGALGDLAVAPVLIVASFLFVLERWMEQKPLRSLLWNTAHTVVRPLAGLLLSLLALSDLSPGARWAGALAGGALALAAHVTRSGWGLLPLVMNVPNRTRVFVSVGEDVGVLALLALLLDHPRIGVGVAAVLTAAGLWFGRSAAGAFAFALDTLWDTFWALLRERRWRAPERFPRWIQRAVADPTLVPGGGLRGSPAAAVNLPGLGVFRRGWVVVRGGPPLFLFRQRGRTEAVDLGTAAPVAVVPEALHTRVELSTGGKQFALYFSLGGPGPDDLRAEFSG
jgi:hypothetical protein